MPRKGLQGVKANPLGDIRAESDHEMLGLSFIETPDYKTLISTADRGDRCW